MSIRCAASRMPPGRPERVFTANARGRRGSGSGGGVLRIETNLESSVWRTNRRHWRRSSCGECAAATQLCCIESAYAACALRSVKCCAGCIDKVEARSCQLRLHAAGILSMKPPPAPPAGARSAAVCRAQPLVPPGSWQGGSQTAIPNRRNTISPLMGGFRGKKSRWALQG